MDSLLFKIVINLHDYIIIRFGLNISNVNEVAVDIAEILKRCKKYID